MTGGSTQELEWIGGKGNVFQIVTGMTLTSTDEQIHLHGIDASVLVQIGVLKVGEVR